MMHVMEAGANGCQNGTRKRPPSAEHQSQPRAHLRAPIAPATQM